MMDVHTIEERWLAKQPYPTHAQIAERWAAQYRIGRSGGWDWINDDRGAAAIHAELEALVETVPSWPTEAQTIAFVIEINRIIGNDSWTV
jgi:hypothetical protein